MSIGSTNSAQPVQVNGFACRNCTDVDNAKKHIDPAHPRSGPYGVDAATDPTNPKRLSAADATSIAPASRSTGRLVDIQA
jgi:hypothetical protein